jgi:hypothetical protein
VGMHMVPDFDELRVKPGEERRIIQRFTVQN